MMKQYVGLDVLQRETAFAEIVCNWARQPDCDPKTSRFACIHYDTRWVNFTSIPASRNTCITANQSESADEARGRDMAKVKKVKPRLPGMMETLEIG